MEYPLKGDKVKPKRILILKPNETRDKMLSQHLHEHKRRRGTISKKKLQIAQEMLKIDSFLSGSEATSQSSMIEAVEFFKPQSGEPLNQGSVKDLTQNLYKSFTRDQMRQYLAELRHKQPPSRYSKREIAEYIVTNIWKSESGSTNATFLSKEIVPLSKMELFFLSAQNGYILQHMRNAVTSLELESDNQSLVLNGTASQIANAKVLLAAKFESVYKVEEDLSFITHMYEKESKSKSLEKIMRENDVYSEKLEDHKYLLCSLQPAKVERVKRLLLWNLNNNQHHKTLLHLPSSAELEHCLLIQCTDTLSSDWEGRSKSHFHLINESHSQEVSSRVKNELERFSNLQIDDLDLSLDPAEGIRNQVVNSDETFDLLERLGFLKEDIEHEKSAVSPNLDAEMPMSMDEQMTPQLRYELHIVESDKASLYSQLTDFGYRRALHGVSEGKLDSAIFTVTLGRTLFSKDREENSIFGTAPSKDKLTESFSFSTNTPLVYDQALARLMVKEEMSTQDDPHNYYLQFKFLPSPYEEALAEVLEDKMKYPPIEMWIRLNEKSVLDLESVQVVTVEGENNAYVCLPKLPSDFKVTCQMTGEVLNGTNLAITNGTNEDTYVLSQTAKKFSHLSAQPGVERYIGDLRVDFASGTRPHIPNYMDVVINGKKVQYAFISLRHRRELSLELENKKTVQLNVIDGGQSGGRRLEVRFIGEYGDGISRENFDLLIDYCAEFISEL